MIAEVRLWGRRIGAVELLPGAAAATFQYDPEFVESGIQVSPLTMPLKNGIYSFPELPSRSFHGLPGLLADSLPDRFGNALVDRWLAMQGRSPESFSAVERLCYTGNRGMGALEFRPLKGPKQSERESLSIDDLVELASRVLRDRDRVDANFEDAEVAESIAQILRVGTSAGGARAKAVIAWNPETNEVRSGQIDAGSGFDYWLLKFDGVSGNRDKELDDPLGYGAIEYAYYLMATAAGIEMSESRILEENGRRHFITKRFDRVNGKKIHMQSLAALCHFDFNAAGAHSYEQAFLAMRKIGLETSELEQIFRRMIFNVVARNQDDHVKNIAFLMDRSGIWKLAPAFDITYSYNPTGDWTASHQMTVNGKRDGFDAADFAASAKTAILPRGRWRTILDEVIDVVRDWPRFAASAGVASEVAERIGRAHRISHPGG